MTSPSPPNETVLFRPSKKRKIYRQRTTEDTDEPSQAPLPTAPPAAAAQSLDELIASNGDSNRSIEVEGGEEDANSSVSMAEILRLRKQRRVRGGGVGFRAEGRLGRDEDSGALAVKTASVNSEGDGEGSEGAANSGVLAVVNKFAPQTGALGNVDKHMMAYIDSRLAQSRLEGLEREKEKILRDTNFNSTNTSTSLQRDTRETSAMGHKVDTEVQRQPAALGKLLEIDLGDEARDRNVERTEQARRRLDGEEVEDDTEQPKKNVKIRLGPDGKPWRSKKKRRGSDDIKRDKIVEDVLRENRLEIYDELPVESAVINDDQAADDRIAEAFRREFMDAVSQRQRKKVGPPQPPSRNAGGKKEEELKGPKLGGSRNARAAMRETLLKAGKK